MQGSYWALGAARMGKAGRATETQRWSWERTLGGDSDCLMHPHSLLRQRQVESTHQEGQEAPTTNGRALSLCLVVDVTAAPVLRARGGRGTPAWKRLPPPCLDCGVGVGWRLLRGGNGRCVCIVVCTRHAPATAGLAVRAAGPHSQVSTPAPSTDHGGKVINGCQSLQENHPTTGTG